jgi:hypothetical protein
MIAARKTQTPSTSQRSFPPVAGLSDFSQRESAPSGLSQAGEAGGPEGAAVAFFLKLPLMKKANKNPTD